MLENYLLYLGYITDKIQKFFDEQSDYIFCQKGCALCCKHAQFPYTKIEFKLLYEGFKSLNPEIQKQILSNIDKIIEEKRIHERKTPNERFRYDCPFLINNECSVYYYRGLVCRTFGLMTFVPNSKEKTSIPFCAFNNLNYSNVLDKEQKIISEIKYAESKSAVEPKAYNIDYKTLIHDDIAKGFGFEFGEVKALIEWLIDIKEKHNN